MKRFFALGLAASAAYSGTAAGQATALLSTNDVLLLDNLGHAVNVPTNTLPVGLLPSDRQRLNRQIPDLLEGAELPPEVRERQALAPDGRTGFEFFPAAPPPLMPYLPGIDVFGNTAFKPGPLFPPMLQDTMVQQPKYWLSDHGLRYKLAQSFTFLTMSEVKQGDNTMGFYSLDLKTKWNVFDVRDAGTAGWISAEVKAKAGLGSSGRLQDPKSNLGTVTSPNINWSSVNGLRVPELAWQESLSDGRLVVLAGMVSQRNYIDGNAYAHTAYGQFLNSALVHSQVVPLADYNFGMNVQWQPRDEWYAMLGGSAGNAEAGQLPWTDFSWQSWSLVGEFGYAPDNFWGLGPGVYRVQPFIAQTGGPIQGGLAFNLQQQLGEHAPFGWFGRFGFGGDTVSAGASAQVGTGFVAKGPLAHLGLFPSRQYDSAGVGFIWSQPSATSQTVFHENEYALEAGYVLQLTPTAKLQPDLQIVWNPAHNPDAGPAVVFQLQLDFEW